MMASNNDNVGSVRRNRATGECVQGAFEVGVRPRVLVFCDHYLPSQKAGGPAKSVHSVVAAVACHRSVLIVTRDRDRADTHAYQKVRSDTFQRGYGAWVYYGSPGLKRWCAIANLLRRHAPEVVYLNSVFSLQFSIWILLLIRFALVPRPGRVVLAPRGELAATALLIKPHRKALYKSIARMLGLYEGVVWHAGSEREQNDIVNAARTHLGLLLRAGDVQTVPPIVAPPIEVPPGRRKKAGVLRMVFLSRISELKNLKVAIAAVRELRGEIRFDIYGAFVRPEDKIYWRECRAMMDELPANVTAVYSGFIARDQVIATLARYHVFILPSAGESFGHAIAEALSAGCIVCVSDRTPWRDLERKGIGWDLSLERPGEFARVLQRCVDMDQAQYDLRIATIRNYARRNFNPEIQRERLLDLFRVPNAGDLHID